MACPSPQRPKPTINFDIETRIKAPFTAAYDYYVKPENIPSLHPFVTKVDVTNVTDKAVSFTVQDKIPLACGISFLVSTKATFFLDQSPTPTSRTLQVEGSAPMVKLWLTTKFSEDPSDAGSCIVTEHYNCTCPAMAKDFTRSRAYEAHVSNYNTLKRLLEEQIQ